MKLIDDPGVGLHVPGLLEVAVRSVGDVHRILKHIRDAEDHSVAVIILGGGLTDEGQPHPFVQERIRVGSLLVNETEYFILCSRGTTHKPPPRDSNGHRNLDRLVNQNIVNLK